jgi:hypothetical protein
MSMIRNSVRAFAVALAPLAVYHALITAIGLGGYLAYPAWIPTPDRTFSIFLTRLAIDAGLLMLGHLLLRSIRVPTRTAYAAMGGAAAFIGYVLALWGEIWIAAPTGGTRLVGAVLPVFAGAIAGFLYAQFAGREPTAHRRPEAARPAAYDGPVQVRTSIAATAIAATTPAVFATVLAIPLSLIGFGDYVSFEPQPSVNVALQIAIPAQTFLVTLVASMVPAAIVVCAAHGIARGLGWMNGGAYAVIGAAVSCGAALTLVALVEQMFLFPAAACVGALMGAVYRLFAGLEPLALPEPVLVDDAARLVDADHPARRQHAVITEV